MDDKPEIQAAAPTTLAAFADITNAIAARRVKDWVDHLDQWEKDHELWFGPTVPPTRWQRLSYPFKRAWWNLRDAALVLVGKKEARDPYDD